MPEARVTEPEALPLVAAPAPTEAAPSAGRSLAGLADVFFDFDLAAIRPNGRAALLKGENGWQILISCHCDERGTQAYNLVLGERRAQAAKRYLADLGLTASRIQVDSYGEEKPFCTEHTQECWQKNRRAHVQMP